MLFVSQASERKACGHRRDREKPNARVCVRVLEGIFFFFPDQRVSFGVLPSLLFPSPPPFIPDLFEKDSDLFSHTQTDLIVEE